MYGSMVPSKFSGKQKAIIIICCILIVAAGLLFLIGLKNQADENKHIIQLHLKKTAGRIAGQVNGDGLLSLKPGDEGTPLYLALAQEAYNARKNESYIVNAYILRVDNGTITYVIDDQYLVSGPGPLVAPIGYPVTEDKDVIRAALNGPVYSPDIYTSRWGSYLSGYAPVRDSNGTVVGILGIDETEDIVHDYELSSLFHLVEVT
ncbi:MAG TPA: hypothetical protein VHN82_08585 [Methanoregula sp.]|nr:hypothetical protein [Methanoregula sp.]